VAPVAPRKLPERGPAVRAIFEVRERSPASYGRITRGPLSNALKVPEPDTIGPMSARS